MMLELQLPGISKMDSSSAEPDSAASSSSLRDQVSIVFQLSVKHVRYFHY